MKKLFLTSILFLVLLVPASSMARTDVFLNFGVGVPAPVFIAPSPVVAPPPPVFVAPAPIIVAPPPFVVVQPAPVIVGPPGRHKHHRHIKFEEDD